MKKRLLKILLGLLIPMAIVSTSSCAWNTVPRINQGDDQTHLPGKFVWYDLFTSDLSKAAAFYHELFGWEFASNGLAGSRIETIRFNGKSIANAVEIAEDSKKRSQWLGYISIDDVDSAMIAVNEHGGRVHMAPKEVPHRGRVAVCFDPQGAVFALVRSSSGDPADQTLIRHQLIGSELWTNDVDSALYFYYAVVGYAEMPVPTQDGGTYRLLTADSRPRAGIAEIVWDDVQPNWIPYVVVNDVAEIVTQAEAIGGQLLLGLRGDASEDTAAILADPTGGIFGVQKLWQSEGGQP